MEYKHVTCSADCRGTRDRDALRSQHRTGRERKTAELARFQRGFTLVELLVVIAIIGILVALLLPAIQAARESARRTQCINHQKQVALALHNHHDTYKQFPSGQFGLLGRDSTYFNRGCWFHKLLPFVEESAMSQIVEAYWPANGTPKGPYVTFAPNNDKIVTVFLCPSDPNNPKVTTNFSPTQGFHGNFVLCAGSDFYNPPYSPNGDALNGIFYCQSKTNMKHVVDGTSKTFLMSELRIVPDRPNRDDGRGRYWNTWDGNNWFSTRYPPNTTQPDRIALCASGPESPCTNTNAQLVQSVRSYHPGGANFTLADASIRFVADDVNAEIYKAYGTRAGLGKADSTVPEATGEL